MVLLNKQFDYFFLLFFIFDKEVGMSNETENHFSKVDSVSIMLQTIESMADQNLFNFI